EFAAAVLKPQRPARACSLARARGPADEYPLAARAPPDVREGGRCGSVDAGIVQMILLYFRGARPDQGDAAQRCGRVDRRFQFGRILRRDDGAGLGARLGSQPYVGSRPLTAPERLAILRKPTLYGGAIEGDPYLAIRRAAILLDVAARIADQRPQSRVVLRRAVAGDANQDHFHCRLEGSG